MTDRTPDTQSATYHRGKKNYGTGYDMMARIDELEAKLAKAVEALEKCRDELDAYVQNEYPLDHPVQERCRQRDYAANPARIALVDLANE